MSAVEASRPTLVYDGPKTGGRWFLYRMADEKGEYSKWQIVDKLGGEVNIDIPQEVKRPQPGERAALCATLDKYREEMREATWEFGNLRLKISVRLNTLEIRDGLVTTILYDSIHLGEAWVRDIGEEMARRDKTMTYALLAPLTAFGQIEANFDRYGEATVEMDILQGSKVELGLNYSISPLSRPDDMVTLSLYAKCIGIINDTRALFRQAEA